jgi:hypothetical protein
MTIKPVAKPIVEINEKGELKLPEELLGRVKPHTRFEVELQGETLVLSPATAKKRFWETATTEEWLEAFGRWVDSLPPGPDIPLEALRRENLYD